MRRRMRNRARIEKLRGRWVTVLLSNGREYTGYLRKLRDEGWQMYVCGSSGPFTMGAVCRIREAE